jgi:amino acid transporter
MYGFAPISLAVLRKLDRDRPRTYSVPQPWLLLPAGFCSANLIIYWGGFGTTWKLVCAMLVGQALFAIGTRRAGTDLARYIRSTLWVFPWFAGQVLIGALGRYGGYDVLPPWVDILVMIGFSLVIFQLALRMTLSSEACAAAVAKDAHQIEYDT